MLGGMEFYDVNFSYIDLDTFEEKFVSVPEQGGGKLIPEWNVQSGTDLHCFAWKKRGMIGVFRLESQMLPAAESLNAPVLAATVTAENPPTQPSTS